MTHQMGHAQAPDQGPEMETLRLDFEHPQWAVTPGQSAVLYDGEVCLGGGVITRAQVPLVVSAAAPKPARRPRGHALTRV